MTPYVSLPAPPGNQTNLVGCGERQVTRELGKEDHQSWEVLTISLPEEVKTARQHRCTGESGSMTELNQYSMVNTGPKILGVTPVSDLQDRCLTTLILIAPGPSATCLLVSRWV